MDVERLNPYAKREHEERFWRYHAENPRLYELLRTFALRLWQTGRLRGSIRQIWERVRWEVDVETTGTLLKMNDHFHSFYARLLMRQEPELKDFFETRHSPRTNIGWVDTGDEDEIRPPEPPPPPVLPGRLF